MITGSITSVMTKKAQCREKNIFPPYETKPSSFFVFVHYFGAALKKMANEERDHDFAKAIVSRAQSSIRISARVFV